MIRRVGLLMLVLVLGATAEAAAPPGKPRALTKEEEKEVAALQSRLNRHADAGKFEQAAKVAQQIADYRRPRQGARHWEVIDARFGVEEWIRLVGVAAKDRAEVVRAQFLSREGVALGNKQLFREAERTLRESLRIREKVLGPEHPDTATSYNNIAAFLNVQQKAEEALLLYRQAIRIREKVLGKEHPDTASSYNGMAASLKTQGKVAEALLMSRKALLIREKALGKDHPRTAISYTNVASCLTAQGKAAEALPLHHSALLIFQQVLEPDHLQIASSYHSLASCLVAQGKSTEALPLHRKALQIREKVLGKEHATTVASFHEVATCLLSQGKAAEALPLFRSLLSMSEKLLGKDHPDTAANCNNTAYCLNALGRSSEALPLFRKALRIREMVSGREHPDTATSYNNVAACLNALGRSAEALPLHRKALLIQEKLLGPDHLDTATSYNNVASCLNDQGTAAEALSLFRKALRIRETVLGCDHPETISSYNNVAYSLHEQGKIAEALPLFQKALRSRETVLGPNHPDTATSYNNVASCLLEQGKAVEALSLFQKALRSRETVLGPNHPDTATSYNNVAACLNAQRKAAEALPQFRKALQIREKVLGEEHRDTANSYNNLSFCLWKQDRPNEALRLWQKSLRAQEAARMLRAESGFDRAQGESPVSPRAALALGLAHLKQPRNAFRHAEASLARGLLDDLSSLTRDETQRLGELRTQMARLDPALASFAASDKLSGEQKARQGQSMREYGRLSRELSDLLTSASERVVLPLEQIQKAIPADAALVLWIVQLDERWGCVLRAQGSPVWRKLAKPTDSKQVASLYGSLTDPGSDDGESSKQLALFRKQQFDPLRPHLKGVKQLFVVPTGALAYIPADLLADDFAIRYIPSGSFLARTIENHRALDASSLLAVGDPVFDKAPPAESPASGILVLSVLPNTFGAKAGLQSGDVLLSIGKTTLESIDDLSGALSSLPANADVWRDGKTFTVRLQGSPLGATFDKRSSRAAVRAWRREREATAQRSTGHKRLPGTRLEIEAISSMVKGSTSLLGSDASEQRLDDLIDSGTLKSYRILHFATHGEPNVQIPRLSSLILAQDALPDPAEQVKALKHPYDGRVTVSRIRERWQLDADLVVLSACETGIGKDAKGDGLLGFAQAFLSRGARSVVLSRWKVDDTATSLLMIRLYENLLGKRKGVKPMGRAASLDEAKKWLRTLPRKEAERLATLHTGGVLRGSEGTEKTPDKAKKVEYKGDTPFAHPYYWAAFTLIGDPD